MTNESGEKQTNSASKVIKASPGTIYQAFLDAEGRCSMAAAGRHDSSRLRV